MRWNQLYPFILITLLSALIITITGCSSLSESDRGAPLTSLKIKGDYTGCGIGAVPFDGLPIAGTIEAYEDLISREMAVVSFYRDFTFPFPASTCDIINAHGSIPMLTWEPRNWSDPTDTSYSLAHIISGDCDAAIKNFALGAKAWGKPFFLRFAHEMDGFWYPWSGAQNGSNADATESYKMAWRRIHATFEALGVNNTTWVWCPNQYSNPHDDWNAPGKYYPGDSYVDWVGTDGFSGFYAYWGSFYDLFNDIYVTLESYGKPIMICEMGRATDEVNGGKAAWVSDTFNKIQYSYNKIKLYIWFNIDRSSFVGESDWRIQTPPSGLAAIQFCMTSEAYYLSKIH